MTPRDEAWDSAELPAPVPAGVGMEPRVTAHLFSDAIATPTPATAAPSANQLMLRIRAGMEQLEWCVPHHDGPWFPTLQTRELMSAHGLTIINALNALVSLPARAPDPLEAADGNV